MGCLLLIYSGDILLPRLALANTTTSRKKANTTNGSIYNQLDAAKEKEDKEAAQQILAVILQEKDKRLWRRLSYSLGKPRGGACFKVQVEQADGTVTEYTGQDELQEAIWTNIHIKGFHLAKSAPL